MSVNFEDEILSSATAVRVTNILTPYAMRIYEINDYMKNIECIGKSLFLFMQKMHHSSNLETHRPKLGDNIVLRNKWEIDMDTQGWFCRGVICDIIVTSPQKYNILLIDYGTIVQLEESDFVVVTDSITDDPLTYTVSLYNIIPASKIENTTLIEKDWSQSAIRFVKQAVEASTAVYFHALASDADEITYGEFYLEIEDELICLSEVLVRNAYAIYLKDQLLKFLKEPKIKLCDNKAYHVNISNKTEMKSIKSNTARKKNSADKKKSFNMKFEDERQKLLIYNSVNCEYLSSVLDARFPTGIHKAWTHLVKSSIPKRLQSYIWPAIRKGLDVIGIGTTQSGKTFGSVVALCGLLASFPTLPKGVKPSLLILCASSSEVLQVHSLCTEFLQNYPHIKSVAAVNGKSERSIVAEMFNGCQILVSTPRFLQRFMQRNNNFLNFKHLRYLLLDDADILLDQYFDSISYLFKKQKVIQNRETIDDETGLQIIMTAKHWTQVLKKFSIILMRNPFICISSFIEATIFKNVRPKMYITSSGKKKKTIFDLLGDDYINSRTMIVCVSAEESEDINQYLSQHKKTLLANENMNLIQLQNIKRCWDVSLIGHYPILICTDEVLSDMDVIDVEWLIHYSISLHKKTQFNFRFSSLLCNLHMEKCCCKVTIMVDENNDVQFQNIIRIMQRMNVVISEEMLKNIEHIAVALDRKKDNYQICDNLKAFGFCYKRNTCSFRHCFLPKIDEPITELQTNDKVKLMVNYIHDVSHVSARIISYIKSESMEEIEFSNTEYLKLSLKMYEFYSCVENRRRSKTVNVGDICGFEESLDCFKRVQVLNIEEDSKNNPKWADLRCIDSGLIVMKVNVFRLLYIPEHLRKLPTQLLEVFIIGLTPHDDEHVWNSRCVNEIHEWFHENVDENSHVTGTVKLHIGNTIWVDTLEVATKLIGYKELIGSSLTADLIKNDYAVENKGHLQNLLKYLQV